MEAAELIKSTVIPMLVCLTISNLCILAVVLVSSKSNKKEEK